MKTSLRTKESAGTKAYRNEWKYCCTDGELALLESRLRQLLPLDEHTGPAGRYEIHSLYFDDYWNICARDNEAGAAQRFKYRIRYYGTQTAPLLLERKEKYYNHSHKDSCVLTRQEYDALTEGDAAALFWQTEKPLLRRFCADIQRRHFTPKVIVDYERTAFVEPITNIRITLDRNISASPWLGEFLSGTYQRYPLQAEHCHILEVKFDAILPGYIRETVSSHNFEQTSFSKYYLARRKIEEIVK